MAQAIYDQIGEGYARRRQPDPRIAAIIQTALGPARTVINVGAGTGSYEPTDRVVLGVEPSDLMINQRPKGAAPCVRRSAEALPAEDASFDAALAVLTIHHWSDWRLGLRELRRVARNRIVLLMFDAEASAFWLTRDYFPKLSELDRRTTPPLDGVVEALGGGEVTAVPIPYDCVDGFLGAYWRRPNVYLDPIARQSMSPFAKIDVGEGLKKLAKDLDSGVWQDRNSDILDLDALDVGYRLVTREFDGK